MPTLTGFGESAHLMSRTIDLGTHVQDIRGMSAFGGKADIAI